MRRQRFRGEHGASLILAIAFMVVVGGVSLATISYVTSGIGDRKVLDNVRDREYAADGAIEHAISQVRDIGGGGPGIEPCGPYDRELNDIEIQVDCENAPAKADDGSFQHNVVFTACEKDNAPCNDENVIIRAQVNFQVSSAGGPPVVGRTYMQAWSVNR